MMRIHRIVIGMMGAVMAVSAGTGMLTHLSEMLEAQAQTAKEYAVAVAMREGLPIRQESINGAMIEIQKVVNGKAFYYTTDNEDAAITTRTNHLWEAPYGVTGSGYDRLGEWDGGAVRGTHDELTGRVTQVDSPATQSNHSTHVAGTLIASGVKPSAKGMAYEASLLAYDWNDDASEMASAAANGMEISNHSYGYLAGWSQDDSGDWSWNGDTSVDADEDYKFGYYDQQAHDWDDIAYHAPYYLIVKSAGNDRNDAAPSAGTTHTHNGSGSYTDTHYDDGYDHGGYDTIAAAGIAKNVLTVGAVDDVANYTSASDVHMSTFSGWGPADDGRIKPDLVADGVDVYSSIATGDSDYGSMSGTSMASPNAAGSLVLLQQYYQTTHSGASMRAATLKALVIHTADEAGEGTGPDYRFGWGLLNAKRAADTIQEDQTRNVIDEQTLAKDTTYTRDIEIEGGLSSFKVTLVWTDPAGTPVAEALDPADPMLVHDLDLRLTRNGVTYYPWKLDKDHPENNATHTGKNHIDTVEQVEIDHPEAGTYQIVVDHTGTLSADQNFSLILDPVQPGTPEMAYAAHRIDDDNTVSSGNGDGVVNAGETIQMPITLENVGNGTAHHVEANLSTSDTCVTITDRHLSWGDIAARASHEASDYDFNVTASCPNGHTIAFHLEIASDEGTWGDDFNVSVVANQVPVADAGADQTVQEGSAVLVDGSGSSDADGSISTYHWQEGNTTLTHAIMFSKSDFSVGTHTLTLSVTDDDGATGSDTVVITVVATNHPPTADAGSDTSITIGGAVTLTGNGTDSDGSIVAYQWREGSVILADTATLSYTADTVGTHTLTLSVTDDDGATDEDTVVITVHNTPADTGGGCTYNPHSRSVDVLMVCMMLIALSYPWVRRMRAKSSRLDLGGFIKK